LIDQYCRAKETACRYSDSLKFIVLIFRLNIFKYFITMSNQYCGVKTKQQMADEYGVCRKTFARLLVKKNITLGRGLIYPKDQENIYNVLGEPVTPVKFPNFPINSH
jgi:hypothetical protein